MKLNSILFGIILFGIIGCTTQKRCYEKFPPITFDSVIVKDSVYAVHDTIYTPYQELSFDTLIPCDPKIVYVKEVKKGGLTGSVSIKGGKMSFECKSDSLQAVISRLERKITTNRLVREIPKTIEVKYTAWYWKALGFLNIFWLIVCFVLYLAYRWK